LSATRRPTPFPPAGTAAPGLVVGLGTDERRDDACGLAVARVLRGPLTGRAEVVELRGEPTALLDLWAGRPWVIAIDAVVAGGPPGQVHRLEVGRGELAGPLARGSSHGLSLVDAVALARTLDRMPGRLVVYGIEPADVGLGVGLTPDVAAAVEDVAERILAEVPPDPGHHADRGAHA
jgi:hydrogenase maturation protease